MREHKYRGKCTPDSKYAGEWVEGSLVVCEDGTTLIVCAINDHNSMTYHVIPETVGEFSGQTDKKSNEIYEDDIVKTCFSKKPFGVVTWHPHGYFFIRTRSEKYAFSDEYKSLGEMLKVHINGKDPRLVVVGNIHDNPDMLSDFV